MGSVNSKGSTGKKKDETDWLYKPLKPKQRKKLETFFQHIILNAAVDFTSPEIMDIQTAVHIMLGRIERRINERGVCDITRIAPTGSMAEEMSIWRLDRKEPYLEFDYLAVVKPSIRKCEDKLNRNSCPGCSEITNPPVDFFQYYFPELQDVMDKDFFNDFFKIEVHTCLTSLCDCLIPNHTYKYDKYICYSYKPSAVHKIKACDMCTVDMPTGILSVNTETAVDKFSNGLSNCSLILQWTSKRKSMLAPDKFLLQKHPVVSLPIYIDFLPTMESLKQAGPGDEYEHDYFIVPKRCNVCSRFTDDDEYRWRKSWCMTEIQAFRTKMSDRHRRCYQIMKYLTTLSLWRICLNKYLIKTIVLQHSIRCSDTTDDCVDCVLEVYRDIIHAYNTRKFLSYLSNLSITSIHYAYIDFLIAKIYFQTLLTELRSESETEKWDKFILKLIHVCESYVVKEYCKPSYKSIQ